MAEPEQRRVVWVLGAGFSRSLGAPLLDELLSPERFRDLIAAYPQASDLHASDAQLVIRLFHYGMRYARGPVDINGRDAQLIAQGRGERLWEHAEGFLDALEAASATPANVMAQRLNGALNALAAGFDAEKPGMQRMLDLARRMIALECCRFLQGEDTLREQWDPYLTWRALIDGSTGVKDRYPTRYEHTIVTFNYDLVLERLGGEAWVQLPPQKDANFAISPGQTVAAYKLHGSVNWEQDPNESCVRVAGEDHAATCDPRKLMIATPGPGKVNATKVFRRLWERAEGALQIADAVFFVGYRFPPSDSRARQRLLGALGANSRRPFLHAVLGPNLGHQDVARLSAMLRYCCPNSEVKVHPLFAEDFLSLATPRLLYEWSSSGEITGA